MSIDRPGDPPDLQNVSYAQSVDVWMLYHMPADHHGLCELARTLLDAESLQLKAICNSHIVPHGNSGRISIAIDERDEMKSCSRHNNV
jgi:hypothetical protein